MTRRFGLVFVLLSWGTVGAQEAVLFRPPDKGALLCLDRLQRASPEAVQADWDPGTGMARAVEGRFPLAASSVLAEECSRFLDAQGDLFGWRGGLELRPVAQKKGAGMTHLRCAVHFRGIPLAGGEVTFHVEEPSPSSEVPVLTYLTARLCPELERVGAQDLLEPRISASEAVESAVHAVSPRRSLRRDSTATLEIHAATRPIRLAYAVRIYSREPRGLFLVRVDARTGEVFSAGDLLRYGPPGERDGTGKVFLVSPLVALPGKVLSDMDDSSDAVPAEAYAPVVLPQLDGGGGLTGPFVTTEKTPHAVRRVSFEFSFLRDFDGFEEVMAYYHIDALQRYIQSLGFTDIYNEPISVYANSEPPGIPYTEAQAYFQPSEEHPGTGLLAFGSGGVDTAEDPEVIAHEYGHAVQENQVPGFGGTFENLETFAVGEGWSDYFAAAYFSALSGGRGDACLGEWVATSPAAPGAPVSECIRRLDSTKHYPEDLHGEPHDDGEMWAASLWRIAQELGRDDSLKLVLQSNFFLQAASGFEDAAKAVLRADRQLFRGEHADFISDVFEQRGFLSPPLNLPWFYVVKQAPAAQVPPMADPLRSKLRIERPGTISTAENGGLEVYVSIASPLLGEMDLTLRSPSGRTVALNRAGSRVLPGRPLVFGLTVEPSEDLGALAGDPISGVWTLQVANRSWMDASLSEWGLRFQGFIRGDANADGKVGILDAIALLEYLFRQGRISCPKAADFNDSGSLNVMDAIGVIRYSVAGGLSPPEPFPTAGEDLTPDALPCGR